MNMKALVKYQAGMGCMEVCLVPVPKPEDKEVLLKVLAGGVCGTDIHVWKGEWEWKQPFILGHEFVGEIIELGKQVQGYSVGERVVTEVHHSYCGTCSYCLTGLRHFCPGKKALGLDIAGGFAEYVSVPLSLLHKLPESIDTMSAALMEPTAIAVYAIMERAQITVTDTVLAIGPGPIGILSAQVAKAAGAKKVIVLGTDKDKAVRLKICEELGFTTYNVQENNINDILARETGEAGFDVVIEASGAVPGIQTAINVTKKNGQIVAIGIPGNEMSNVPWAKAVHKALTIKMSYSSSYSSWEKAVALISQGKVRTLPLITHKSSLEEWEDLFNILDKGEGVKGVIIP